MLGYYHNWKETGDSRLEEDCHSSERKHCPATNGRTRTPICSADNGPKRTKTGHDNGRLLEFLLIVQSASEIVGFDRKRPLDEADPSSNQAQSAAKRSAPSAAEAAHEASNAQASGGHPAQSSTPVQRRISRGPNGETLIPRVMPQECHKEIPKIPIPSSWIFAIDATPDCSMTLESREWWEDYGPWLEANKSKLKLSAKNWNRKEIAMKKEWKLKKDEGNDHWDFVCLPEPRYRDDDKEDEDETEEEEEENEDENGNEGENESGEAPKTKKNPAGKLASAYPDHISTISMLGRDRASWWQLESLKRDQDDFLMHIYNDFTNYGRLEVIENIFLHFEKILKDKNVSHHEVWASYEGFVATIQSGLLGFAMCDDSNKCAAIIELIGFLTIIVLDFLKKRGVLSPDSDIPNFGFTLASIIQWVWLLTSDFTEWRPKATWVYRVMDMAEEAGITLRDPGKWDELVEKINANKPASKSLNKWKPVSWTTKLRTFKSNHGQSVFGRGPVGGIGGDYYDITKMSAEERKERSYA
ncbi:hypothetical protein B0T10DRAFT_540235 [Thelonectria olida]|uniref:Uncharacterized protein n=1 Tax=Thelonectria olida TaxID=1576542 RepID=A0A9P8VWS5_9HYPO|nr:hypothetical protein B0T10DRAFT_540235 [Thelonectria olida]